MFSLVNIKNITDEGTCNLPTPVPPLPRLSLTFSAGGKTFCMECFCKKKFPLDGRIGQALDHLHSRTIYTVPSL